MLIDAISTKRRATGRMLVSVIRFTAFDLDNSVCITVCACDHFTRTTLLNYSKFTTV